MELNNKSFPYPVLSEYTTDYKESIFETDIDFRREGHKLLFSLLYKLTNEKLETLINEDKVKVIFHIECPQTTFRKAYTLNRENEEISIDETLINGKVEITTFLITGKPIDDYSNDDFDDFYKGYRFSFEMGSIIGIGNQIILIIDKELEDLVNVASIFSIKRSNSIDLINFDYSSTKQVSIYLPATEFDNYVELRKQVPLHSILSSIIIIPVLTEILTELSSKTEDDLAEFFDSLWYVSLEKQVMNKFNMRITDLKNKNSMLFYSQRLIGNPITPAIKTLYNGYSDLDSEGEK